ncbi:inositol-tetrakisphosphate 1-kinase 3-like [Dorcoceras hygrometricum]|uniref:Inositol-tetrakisphosphate 1-kinase 3-like n=1 Tax=Dorcoceras hygrometricum TaxID=472368 RepID=A0A2Z7DE75_9LAMI|nr:inositol-tetrakisphosphate 1-kinase 3-like [Dorcoceras hygrometricum]
MIVLDFSGTTHQSSSHNVALNQVVNQSVNQAQYISRGTANLKPSLIGHDNSAAKQLKHNFKTEENTYPKAYTNRGTLGQDFTESVERTGSSRFLKSKVPVSKLVSIGKETQEEFRPPISFKKTVGHDGNLRKSATVNSSYRGIRRMEIRNISNHQALRLQNSIKMTSFQLNKTTPQRSTSLQQILSKQPTTGCAHQSKRQCKEYVSIAANNRRNQQLVTNSSQLVPGAIPKTHRFNLSKRCRLTSTTGSSNQQLVTQSQPHSHNVTTASSNLYKCNY